MNGKRIRITITHVFALFAVSQSVSHGKWVLPILVVFFFVFSIVQNGDNQMISGTINDQKRTKHHRQNSMLWRAWCHFKSFCPYSSDYEKQKQKHQKRNKMCAGGRGRIVFKILNLLLVHVHSMVLVYHSAANDENAISLLDSFRS